VITPVRFGAWVYKKPEAGKQGTDHEKRLKNALGQNNWDSLQKILRRYRPAIQQLEKAGIDILVSTVDDCSKRSCRLSGLSYEFIDRQTGQTLPSMRFIHKDGPIQNIELGGVNFPRKVKSEWVGNTVLRIIAEAFNSVVDIKEAATCLPEIYESVPDKKHGNLLRPKD
jgi:hypothetical protein